MSDNEHEETATIEDVPVHVAWQRVRSDMPIVGKEHEAPAAMGGFKFRGIEDVDAVLDPILSKHGVFYLPSTSAIERYERTSTKANGEIRTSYETRVHVYLTIYGPQGDTLRLDAWGEAVDAGDKGCGKAATNGRKIALLAALSKPTEDTADSDIDRHAPDETVTEDPYGTVEQYETLKQAVQDLPEDERAKIAGEGKVLGVQVSEVIDGTRRIVMRQSQYGPLMDKLAEIKLGYQRDEEPFGPAAEDKPPPRTPEEKPEAERAGVQPETDHEGKGYDAWQVKELDQWLALHDITDLPAKARRADKIARLREHDVARKAKGEIPETWVEPDEIPFT